MYLDDNGITVYESTDEIVPLETFMNAGMSSVSDNAKSWNRVFSSPSARDSAIPHPATGMEAYTKSDNSKWIYVDGNWNRMAFGNANTFSGLVERDGAAWKNEFSWAVQFGRMIYMIAEYTRTGGNITADSAANITDTVMGYIKEPYIPLINFSQMLTFQRVGFYGSFGRIDSDGRIVMTSATYPGQVIGTNQTWRFSATYITKDNFSGQ